MNNMRYYRRSITEAPLHNCGTGCSYKKMRTKVRVPFWLYHRLNGSLSHVLTATFLSYGKAKNLTPTESKPLTRLI